MRKAPRRGGKVAVAPAFSDSRVFTGTLWILITAFLVFWMQAGFALVEAGLTRSKNTTNILFKNLIDCDIVDYLDKHDFIERIQAGHFDGDIDAIFHEGACSDTMKTDGRYMMENNYRYSSILLDWCQDQDVQCPTSTSAAIPSRRT